MLCEKACGRRRSQAFCEIAAVFNIIASSGLSILFMSVMAPRYTENLTDPLLWKHAVIIFQLSRAIALYKC